jgi:hypothetical protein
VKLIQASEGKFTFQIGERERLMFFEILRLFPVIQKPYQPLSRGSETESMKSDQQMLDDALTAHQWENKKALAVLINNTAQFEAREDGYHFSLDTGEIEWLLQVLNDIRVGSWRLLGCPDEDDAKPLQITDENLINVLALDVAGTFQVTLLEALSGSA